MSELTERAEGLLDELMTAVREAAELSALLTTADAREVMGPDYDVMASVRAAQKGSPPLTPIEDVRAQNDALRIDVDNMTMALGAIENERDRLARELHGSQEALRECQAERDTLKVQLGSFGSGAIVISPEAASAVRELVRTWRELGSVSSGAVSEESSALAVKLDALVKIWGPTV